MSKKGDRHNNGKDRYDLLPGRAIHELVEVFTFGAEKYDSRNWEKGLSYTATIGSLLRHTFAFIRGENKDPESGCHHMAHAAFNCLALVEFFHTGKGDDDRPYAEVRQTVHEGSTCKTCGRAVSLLADVCPYCDRKLRRPLQNIPSPWISGPDGCI